MMAMSRRVLGSMELYRVDFLRGWLDPTDVCRVDGWVLGGEDLTTLGAVLSLLGTSRV